MGPTRLGGPPPRRHEPITAAVAGLIAVAAVVGGFEFGRFNTASSYHHFVQWAAVIVLIGAGSIAIRSTASSLNGLFTRRANPGTGGAVRLVVTGTGILAVIFAVFAVLGVSLQHLLIGAGLTGVILGIAAQQSLSNVFASVVLLFARPFAVGDHIRIRSGTLGVLDVWVLGSGLTYVTVLTDDGVLKVPNSVLLASGIGHLRSPASTATEHPTGEETA
ncbi:MAG TPA: mechanosensitive ion channel family protein [Acidimicrobiales bacterium]|nr:mechanosensitive ion channel family protein [Acidimicrobiales bacterium]